MSRKLFCQRGAFCYALSLHKEYLLRLLHDAASQERFACALGPDIHPAYVVKSHRSMLLRQLDGVDMALQQNKIVNLRIASAGIDGLLIRSGETFSFWRRVGRPSEKRGFLPGLAISHDEKISSTVGGGLCQLANMIHWLALHSPLTVTELHHHSDALFPDSQRRVPFGTGTSVFFSNVDYRFRNDTTDTYQLRIWLDETDLCGELHCDRKLPMRYRIQERNHHYSREADGLYRNSEIWRLITDRASGEILRESLIFRNHSRVLYDEALVPPDEIR